jgi:hypothetical protein
LEVELEVLFFELFIEQLSTFEGRKRHLAKAKKTRRTGNNTPDWEKRKIDKILFEKL